MRPGTHGGSEERGWLAKIHPEGRGAASVRYHGVSTRTRGVSTGTARTRTRVFFFSLSLSLSTSLSLSLSCFLFSLSVLCCVSHVLIPAFRVLCMSRCVVHVFSLVLLLQGVLDRFLLCFCACSFGSLVLDVVVVVSQSPVPSNVSLRFSMCAQ